MDWIKIDREIDISEVEFPALFMTEDGFMEVWMSPERFQAHLVFARMGLEPNRRYTHYATVAYPPDVEPNSQWKL